MVKTKAAYVVSVGRRPGVYTEWLDTAKQVFNVPGAIFKGYATVPEARRAWADQQARGHVKVVDTKDSSSESDDPPTPARAQPRARQNNRQHDSGVATSASSSTTTSTSESSPSTPQTSPARHVAGTGERRRTDAGRGRRDESLSSPATGVSVVLNEQHGTASSSSRSERHRRASSSSSRRVRDPSHVRPNTASAAGFGREDPPSNLRERSGHSSPPTNQTQGSPSTAATTRLSPPTDVTQLDESGHSRDFDTQLALSLPPASSPSSSRAPDIRAILRPSGSRYASLETRTASRSSRAGSTSDFVSAKTSFGVRDSPPVDKVITPSKRHASGSTRLSSRLTSPTTGVTKIIEPSPKLLPSPPSPSQYPATPPSQYLRDTPASSSRHILSPHPVSIRSVEGGEVVRPWSPATDVTYEEPGSPKFASTPLPQALQVPTIGRVVVDLTNLESEGEGEHDDGYATAPSSPRLSHVGALERQSDSDVVTYMTVSLRPSSTSPSRSFHSPRGSATSRYATPSSSGSKSKSSVVEPNVLSAVLSRVAIGSSSTSDAVQTPAESDPTTSTRSSIRVRRKDKIRRAYSEAQVQTEPSPSSTPPRRTHSQAQVQTDSPPRTRSSSRTHRGDDHLSGDATVPVSPALPAIRELGNVNALGLTQSEHILRVGALDDAPAYDPRSPLGRSASLPVSSSQSFGRPSPRMYDGWMNTLVRR